MLIAKPFVIERERVSRGLTKSDLAQQIGVTHSVIIRAEKEGIVSPKTAKAISDYFGVPFFDIFVVKETA